MATTYAESSSQTLQVDPDEHLKSYCNPKPASNGANQTSRQPCEQDAPTKDADGASDNDSQRQLERRLNPTTSKDFEALQTELLQWRKREERKVTITARNEVHRQEMKALLLKKEAHLLRKIEQLKNDATDKARKERFEATMAEMAKPQQWAVGDGVVSVDTPGTRRARDLKEMYDELNQKVDAVSTRIAVLERIKALVETIEPCSITKDVCSLVDRELQMLQKGTDLGPELLEGLRTRLSNQFTKLITRLNADAANSTHKSKARVQLNHPDAVDSPSDDLLLAVTQSN
ncbi:hypothetical protein ACHAXT_000553 [Thalassiosira profunda]